MTNNSIYDMLELWAKRTPDALAIAAPGRAPLTFRGLRSHVNQTINVLYSIGVERGDRVAIVLPNGPEMAVAILAVSSIATSAPLNPAYRLNEFEFYLSDMDAKALIVLSGVESPAIAVAQNHGLQIIRLSPVSSAEAGAFVLSSNTKPTAHEGELARAEDAALVLHTSGTTGWPKLIPLTHSNLCASIENIKKSLDLSNSDRCLNVMPLFHVHGLIGAMLSTLSAGGTIFCTPGFNAAQFLKWMAEFKPSWYTAVPAMHQALLAYVRAGNQAIGKSSLRFIRSCSSALSPMVLAQLEETFGVPVVEAYGMTEASHQIAINPLPPGERKPGSVGLVAGQQVGIMDEKGNLLRPHEVGEVVIRGANVAGFYERDGTANPSTIAGGWLCTGDLGFMDPDGYLFLRGRTQEIINCGGEKISPREVEDVIQIHEAVEEVVVFAVNDASLGQKVAAAIVLRPHQSATEIEIQEFVAARLAEFKVPRRVVFLITIPKGATGKVQRTGLAEKLGLVDTGVRLSGNIAPHASTNSTTEQQLSEIWREVLRVEYVGIHDNFFFDLGGDSLLATELVVRIGQAMGVQLTGATLLLKPTVASLAALLDSPDDSSLVVPLQPMGTGPALFFIHGRGGDVLELVHLAKHLAPQQRVYGVQAPTEGGQPVVLSVKEMAERYVREIRTVQPNGPYSLGGFSTGGTIAFEVAQRLQDEGESVALLVLLDCIYPGLMRAATSRIWKRRIPLHTRRVLRMPISQVTAYIRQRAGTLKQKIGTKIWRARVKSHLKNGNSLPGSLLEFSELIRRAVEEYKPQPYFGRVALFRSAERRDETDLDPDLGWSRSVPGGVEIHEVPGDHLSMLTTQVISLAASLKACLEDGRETPTAVSVARVGES